MIHAFSPIPLMAVMGGSILGALLRYFTNVAAAFWFGNKFPWATLFVNWFGCFAAGIALALLMKGSLTEVGRLFWMVGFLGALTTFSAFSVETLCLLQSGSFFTAIANIIMNVVGSLFAVTIGFWLIRDIFI